MVGEEEARSTELAKATDRKETDDEDALNNIAPPPPPLALLLPLPPLVLPLPLPPLLPLLPPSTTPPLALPLTSSLPSPFSGLLLLLLSTAIAALLVANEASRSDEAERGRKYLDRGGGGVIDSRSIRWEGVSNRQ